MAKKYKFQADNFFRANYFVVQNKFWDNFFQEGGGGGGAVDQ